MHKGTLAITVLTGVIGLAATGGALAQGAPNAGSSHGNSSGQAPIVLQPGSGNQQIQRSDDSMGGMGQAANSGGESGGEGSGDSG